jgi:hypothetical protein
MHVRTEIHARLLLGSIAALLSNCGYASGSTSRPDTSAIPVSLEIGDPDGRGSFGVMLGTQVPLRVRARDAAGREVPPGRVLFASRNPRVASVDSAGVATSVSEGETWLVAEANVNGRTLADSVHVAVTCTAELRMRYSPSPPDTTLRVGESFVPSLELYTCGGLVRVNETLTWRARDPRILHVDSATGRTWALAPGETWIDVTGTVHRRLEGFHVTVRPR